MTALQFVAAAAIRWAGLLALAAVVGGLAVDILVLPPGIPDGAAIRDRLRSWNLIGLVVLMLATAGELCVRAQAMTGGSLAVAIPAIPVVLTRTHFGTIWIVRAATVGILLLLTLVLSPAVGRIGFVLALAVASTTSLTGHAADWGDLSLRVFVDWSHVIASALWIGGLGVLACVCLRHAVIWPASFVAATARRFSRLAGVCLLVVVGSGAYNTWVQIGALSPVWTTAYGRILLVKLLVVGGLVGIGAVNRYAVVPRLDPIHPVDGLGARVFRRVRLALLGASRAKGRRLSARLATNVRREAALALVVFACTAMLGESAPARHAIHRGHAAGAAEEHGPFRVTMSELHESGGVPKGWMFTPPPGDPARGRQAFARLECFRCHTVQGEGFPAPSGAGPDLTGMGEHHPAGYLVESILNPNAVIVEGPGYTGPDGLSTMPDYRESVTVDELIDLVAYLKTR